MPHAEPDDHVELGAGLGEESGLTHGAAERFELARMHLLPVGDAHVLLGDGPHLAADRRDLEATRQEDIAGRLGLVHQPRAVSDPQAMPAHPAGEVHDLLHPGGLAVAGGLGPRGLYGHPAKVALLQVPAAHFTQ